MKQRLIFLVTNFFARFSTTLMSLLILRLYGLESTGIFSYVLSVVAIVVIICEFGMNQTFLIQSVRLNGFQKELLAIRLAISFIILIILTPVWFIFFDKIAYLIIVFSVLFFTINAVSTYFIAVDSVIASAAIRFFFSLVALAILLGSWLNKLEFSEFIHIYPFSSILFLIFIMAFYLKGGGVNYELGINSMCRGIVRDSGKFFLSGIILSLSASLPIIVMESRVSLAVVGEFSVVLRMVMVFYTVFSIISQLSFFELLKSTSKVYQLGIQTLGFMFIAIVGILFLSILPESLLINLFSISEESAKNIISLLDILKYILIFQGLNLTLGQYLAANAKVKYRLFAQSFALSVSMLLFILYLSEIINPINMIYLMIFNEAVALILLSFLVTMEIFKSKLYRRSL